jgi:hypothetical protein
VVMVEKGGSKFLPNVKYTIRNTYFNLKYIYLKYIFEIHTHSHTVVS